MWYTHGRHRNEATTWTFSHQDNSILVCIKPAGVLSTDEPGGVPELVRQALGDPEGLRAHRAPARPRGQRTDGTRAHPGGRVEASAQIREHDFGKTYLAVVHGEPDALQGTYRDLLRRDANERKTYVTDKMAKGVQEAVLDYDVLGTRTELSLVRIYLQTGRTHQIRCQFSARGLPLWGDKKYSTLPDDGPIALWSHCLHFAHPDTGEVLYFEQQPPDISPWSLFAD
ncbi:MAG: RluA family pseudouridine synthase [Oscillospiraceae bacterium]